MSCFKRPSMRSMKSALTRVNLPARLAADNSRASRFTFCLLISVYMGESVQVVRYDVVDCLGIAGV